jgi:hypothetical protein
MTRILWMKRRGVAALSAILVLLFLQLSIVGVIVAGARDQNMTVTRVEGTRAYYAAEGGFQMAVREGMLKVDEDGDGGIATISANGNSLDNPKLGGIPFTVEPATVNSNPGVLVKAGGQNSHRSLRAELTVMGRRIIYCQWSNQFPQYRIWSGSQWGPPGGTLDFGAKQYWMVMKRCPTRQEVIAVCSLQTDILRAAVESKVNSWGNLVTATANCGTTTSRPFTMAYEQSSGRAILAYRNGNSADIHYRIWDGTSWSAQNSTTSPITGRIVWMHMVPKRNSNEIVLLVQDNGPSIAAMVWNGSAFTNKVTLETAASSATTMAMDAAYERSTGRCVVVWGKSGIKNPQVRIWDGSAWSAASTAPALNNNPVWVRLAGDPASNKIMLGTMDSTGRIDANIWSGSAWGSYTQATPNAATVAARCFDVCFEPSGTKGLIVYGHSGQLAPRYRTYNGSGFSSQSNGSALPSVPLLVQLSPSAEGAEIMCLINITGGQNKLEFSRWTGAAFDSLQELESNVSGPSGAEVFMIPDDPEGVTNPTILRAWAEVPPQ